MDRAGLEQLSPLVPPPPPPTRPAWATSLPQRLGAWCRDTGLESDADLAGFFDTATDVVEMLSGKGWTAKEVQEGTLAWTEACHRAGRALAAVQVITAKSRPAAGLGHPRVGQPGLGQPAASTASAVEWQPAASRACFVEADAPEARLVNKAVVREHAKKDEHLETLKVLWLRAGERGLYWQSGTPEDVEIRWKYLVRAGRRLTLATVARHVTAWQAWEKWVTHSYKGRAAAVIFDPAPVDVAAFLDAETERGPTLGRSRLQSFGWLRQRLGLNLPIKDALLADFVNHPQEHEAKQAKVISPSALVNLLGLIRRLGPKKSQEPELVLFLALACVRHKHMMISTITGETADFVFGTCPVGKARRKGRRPPFDWAVPRPACVEQAFSFLLDLAEKLKNPPFAIPARAKTRRLPTRKWLPEPMSYQMAVRIIRQCMVDCGVPGEVAGELTFNSCRRFLPTLGGIFGASRHEAQAIGNWVEDEMPNKKHAQETVASIMPMGVHYCDQKALTSGLVKASVLAKFFALVEPLPKVQAILQGKPGRLLEDELSWDILAEMVQSRGHYVQPLTRAKANKMDRKAKKSKKDKKCKKAEHKGEIAQLSEQVDLQELHGLPVPEHADHACHSSATQSGAFPRAPPDDAPDPDLCEEKDSSNVDPSSRNRRKRYRIDTRPSHKDR